MRGRTAGFVLVGGRSSRMGQDKARLPMRDGRMLAQVVAERVCAAAGNVTLIGRPDAFGDLGYPCLADLQAGCGPMGGLETALAAEIGEWNLIASCDLPDVPVAVFAQLLEAAQRGSALCTVAREADGRRHPLCAVYRAACLPVVQAAIAEGRLRMHELVAEWAGMDVAIDCAVSNVNTPEEWAAWRKRTL